MDKRNVLLFVDGIRFRMEPRPNCNVWELYYENNRKKNSFDFSIINFTS